MMYTNDDDEIHQNVLKAELDSFVWFCFSLFEEMSFVVDLTFALQDTRLHDCYCIRD